MSICGEHGYDQHSMWDDWHFVQAAADDPQLHLACREDLLSRLAPPFESGPILELGSGQRFDAIAISEAGYTVEALEFSPTALAVARKNLAGYDSLRINYVMQDISGRPPYFEAMFSRILLT
jgi:methylase of polypeptide subunit release factors